ncbi:hypothetical protein PMAYCL1PPCAC_29325 [Pristionchus mayeri]|uniref:Tubulin--tyrosine ligase-like protein 9 n=1 Tax=Pristionchus mayeri TaxID=1317129 RepID=A0AAN5ICI1_9BILA|nr:hypothetical protein PMAYCL1PPCAC_29325 [Pristionchus mayeri]
MLRRERISPTQNSDEPVNRRDRSLPPLPFRMRDSTRILFKCSLSNTILDVLSRRPGWELTTGEEWNFHWATREWMSSSFDRYKFTSRQFVNHFRNDFELTRKDNLIKNYKKMKRNLEKNKSKESAKYTFMPASYVLPSEYHIFVEEFKKYPENTIWIMKPVAGAQGRGIFLFRRLKHIQEWKKKDVTGSDALPYVVQSYISRPYLIGGKKFDVRIYVLVTSFRPLTAWVHREGFARFSHSRYTTDCVEDAFVHLTNVAIAKTAPDYDPEKGLKWSLNRLIRFYESSFTKQRVQEMIGDLANLIVNSLRCVEGLIIQDSHCFELYGYDVLLDEEVKPWLLEVNASPSLTASSQDDYRLKYRVLSHMLDIIDLEGKREGKEIHVGGFDLLINKGVLVEKTRGPDPHNCFIPSLNLRLGEYHESKSK